MATLDAVRSLTLDLPPSCIAFCPTQSQLFVVGTYYLHGKEQEGDLREATTTHREEEDNNAIPTSGDPEDAPAWQKRTGSLILFHLEHDNITRVSTITTDFAILDIQWSPHPDKVGGHVLAVATSTGLLALYRLVEQQLVLSSVKRISDAAILVLSLTWHPFRAHVLGLTLSNGSVLLCESQNGLWDQDGVIAKHEIHQHELEAWTMAFTTHRPSAQVLSGGDDVVLQCSQVDESKPEASAAAATLLWKDRKLHEAGVTAILPLSDTLVVTGSYDDHIRLLSLPATGRRQTLASLDLGGGVWRLQLLAGGIEAEAEDSALPTSLVLLASCMHAGARIVRMERNEDKEWRFEILAKFEQHTSMNYGSDVQPGSSINGEMSIVSTSFYDRLMCLWQFELAIKQ